MFFYSQNIPLTAKNYLIFALGEIFQKTEKPPRYKGKDKNRI